jgi:hypothetical protein
LCGYGLEHTGWRAPSAPTFRVQSLIFLINSRMPHA